MNREEYIKSYVKKLADAYNNFKGEISFSAYEKIAKVLDKAEDDILVAIADGKIRFVSDLAMKRCWDRKLKKIPYC